MYNYIHVYIITYMYVHVLQCPFLFCFFPDQREDLGLEAVAIIKCLGYELYNRVQARDQEDGHSSGAV